LYLIIIIGSASSVERDGASSCRGPEKDSFFNIVPWSNRHNARLSFGEPRRSLV